MGVNRKQNFQGTKIIFMIAWENVSETKDAFLVQIT